MRQTNPRHAPPSGREVAAVLLASGAIGFFIGMIHAPQPRTLWEARTEAEWQNIAREFGVTDVLTYPGWRLQLPTVASSAEFVLYEIPSGG